MQDFNEIKNKIISSIDTLYSMKNKIKNAIIPQKLYDDLENAIAITLNEELFQLECYIRYNRIKKITKPFFNLIDSIYNEAKNESH